MSLKHLRIPAIAALLLAAGAVWQFQLSPHAQRRHAVMRAVAELEQATASGDRAALARALDTYLLPEAQVALAVSMGGITFGEQKPGLSENFDKPRFLRFIDLTLYSVHSEALSLKLLSFSPKKDGTAAVKLHVRAYADGDAYLHGFAISSRYTVEGECTGAVSFDASSRPGIRDASCELTLRSAPKAGPQDIQNLKDSLKIHAP